ncbi:hypothetical protein L218DRAFT_649132 [Marasmius fiardii PR-910]|nr:hypothetical protein L218DRAFT_649132 [Marasmius fiardii PR-910]
MLPSMTDPNQPIMEVLTRASKVKIGRGNFSNVGRDQINYYMVDKSRNKRKVGRNPLLLELSEFTEVKRGDISKDKNDCHTWSLYSHGRIQTEIAVYYAEINVAGPFGQKKFTVKTYRGRHAHKEWQRDFVRCSRGWCGDIPLFGYNKSSVPSLIFCGELVPNAHIEDQIGGTAGYCYIDLLRSSLDCPADELWLDPIKGRFCRGPVGPECHERYYMPGAITIPVDMDFLKKDIVQYFSSLSYDSGFFYAIELLAHCTTTEVIPATSHNQVVSSLTNSMIAFTSDVRWWAWVSSSHRDEKLVASVSFEGKTRFCLEDKRRYVEVSSYIETSAWLVQALSVFHAHNISLTDELSIYKHVDPYFELTGTLRKSKHRRQRRRNGPPIYLFLLNSLSPSSTPIYFWSFDPNGGTQISPDECKYLGLPVKLSLNVEYTQDSWPTKAYKALHDYQIARGFNPKTTDFAQSRGHPIFKIVPQTENHFQEVEEDLCIPSESGHSSSTANNCVQVEADSEGVYLCISTQTVSDIQQGMKLSLLGALFAPFTWEAVEGSDISAVAI